MEFRKIVCCMIKPTLNSEPLVEWDEILGSWELSFILLINLIVLLVQKLYYEIVAKTT